MPSFWPIDSVLLGIAASILYLASAGYLLWRLRLGPEAPPVGRMRLMAIAGLALVLHAFVLYQRVWTGAGLDLQFFNAVSLVAWLIALVWLVTALTQPVENLGITILPAAFLALLLELLAPPGVRRTEGFSFALDAHILLSLLAYSVLAIAAVQALLLAVQEKHLRDRHPGGFIRALPPLQTMETLLFRMLGTGFALLSLALASGFAFLEDVFAQHLVHKTVLSITAWLIFALLLWGRWRFGWRGRTAIRWTLGGFAALMLAYFGSKWVLEVVLKR